MALSRSRMQSKLAQLGLGWMLALTVSVPTVSAQGEATAAAQLFAQGNFKAAEPAFENLVKHEPTNIRARYYLALVHLKLAHRELAFDQFKQIVLSAPKSDEARFSGQYLAQIGSKSVAGSTAEMGVTARAVSGNSTNSGPAPNVARIDEIGYWRQLKQSSPQDLHEGLMLKPKYRSDYLSGTPVSNGIMQTHYSDSEREIDERWIASQQRTEQAFNDSTGLVQVAGYNITQFVGYRSGTARFFDADGMCYKVFFDFVDATRDLTPEVYLQFVRELAKAGFVGDSKVPMNRGSVRFFYNNIIVHAGTPENAKLAERIGLTLFNSKLAHYARGVDVMQTKVGDHWTDPIDWHRFLAKNTELTRLSPQALEYIK